MVPDSWNFAKGRDATNCQSGLINPAPSARVNHCLPTSRQRVNSVPRLRLAIGGYSGVNFGCIPVEVIL